MTTNPTCTEVEISVRAAGKVQIVQFKLSNDYEVAYAERYTIPADWTQERIDEWKDNKTKQMREKIELYAQAEQDALIEASDWYKG